MNCARSISLAAEDVRIDNTDGSYTGLDTAAVLKFDSKSCSAASLGTGTFSVTPAGATYSGTAKHGLGKTTYVVSPDGVKKQ